jgi:hypothetical protein
MRGRCPEPNAQGSLLRMAYFSSDIDASESCCRAWSVNHRSNRSRRPACSIRTRSPLLNWSASAGKLRSGGNAGQRRLYCRSQARWLRAGVSRSRSNGRASPLASLVSPLFKCGSTLQDHRFIKKRITASLGFRSPEGHGGDDRRPRGNAYDSERAGPMVGSTLPTALGNRSAIPTFPQLRRRFLYKGEAKTASPQNQ